MMRRSLTKTHRSTGVLAALVLALPLLLAGCGKAEEETVAEDIAQAQEPELAVRDADEPEPREEPVPVMDNEQADLDIPNQGEPGIGAIARFEPTAGNTASGEVTFSYAGDLVMISGMVSGLAPGPHGFHIHETGDCSAPDATSAGGHFNPDGDPHGDPAAGPSEHHAGDFGNIGANAEGVAHFEIADTEISLGDGPKSIIGRAVIVHGGKDDLISQPSGDAGPRVACGVIEATLIDE